MAQQLRQFLRLKKVSELVGYQRSTIYTKIQAGEFPKSYPLGARAVGWLSDEISEWQDARIKAGQRERSQA